MNNQLHEPIDRSMTTFLLVLRKEFRNGNIQGIVKFIFLEEFYYYLTEP